MAEQIPMVPASLSLVGRWVARGYKSQSKGGSGGGLVGDDGDNGDVVSRQ